MKILLSAIATLLLVTACADPANWEPKKLAVNYLTASQTLPITSEFTILTGDEAQTLAAFIEPIPASAMDGIVIESPHAPDSPALIDVVNRLAALGVPKRLITIVPASPGETHITVSYATVTAPHCPDWSGDSSGNVLNNPGSHSGCSTATNFGAMIARPQELVHGSGDGKPDTERLIGVMERYRVNGSGQAVQQESIGQ